MKQRGPIKTTRLFSLQLADHDALFAPYQRRRFSFSWLRLIIYVPAIAFFLMPSFKIGRALLRNPNASIPDSVIRGNIFAIPAEGNELVPQIAGRSLAYIDTKPPLFIGAAPRTSEFEINYVFNDEERNRFKGVVEKFSHPTYSWFVKKVRVTAPPEPSEAPLVKGAKSEVEKRLPPEFTAAEKKALDRVSGNVRLRCWKEPVVEPLGIDPLKPRRNARLGSLPAVGAGEVVFTGLSSDSETSDVLLYHGGGIYTRYWDLKEIRVQKGSKVSTGQTVGHVLLAPGKLVTQATWQTLMVVSGNPEELNPQSVLALSAQLCDLK